MALNSNLIVHHRNDHTNHIEYVTVPICSVPFRFCFFVFLIVCWLFCSSFFFFLLCTRVDGKKADEWIWNCIKMILSKFNQLQPFSTVQPELSFDRSDIMHDTDIHVRLFISPTKHESSAINILLITFVFGIFLFGLKKKSWFQLNFNA